MKKPYDYMDKIICPIYKSRKIIGIGGILKNVLYTTKNIADVADYFKVNTKKYYFKNLQKFHKNSITAVIFKNPMNISSVQNCPWILADAIIKNKHHEFVVKPLETESRDENGIITATIESTTGIKKNLLNSPVRLNGGNIWGFVVKRISTKYPPRKNLKNGWFSMECYVDVYKIERIDQFWGLFINKFSAQCFLHTGNIMP